MNERGKRSKKKEKEKEKESGGKREAWVLREEEAECEEQAK